MLDGVCCDNTDQLFGFSDISRSTSQIARNSKMSEYVVNNCYFRNIKGENGGSFDGKGNDGQSINVSINNCTFVDSCRVGESPLQVYNVNSLKVSGCKFKDKRNNMVSVISVCGERKNVGVENSVFEVFISDWCEVVEIHPHPKVLMASNNPLDFYFGEHMYLETLVGSYRTHASYRSYDLWVDLLKLGLHVYASGGTDTHTEPVNCAVTTMYAREKSGNAFFNVMHSADYAVGAVGMHMCIDDAPMGSEIEWKEGMKLTLRVGDFFGPTFKDGDAYELRIITDKGIAYKSVYDGKTTQQISLEVQKRAFYRAEIVDLNGGYRVSVGNPIWLDKEPEETKTEN